MRKLNYLLGLLSLLTVLVIINACDEDEETCAGTIDVCGICDGNGATTWYQDADCDGKGNPSVSLSACNQPDGYVSDNTDTDDVSSTNCDGSNNDYGTLAPIICKFGNDVSITVSGNNLIITTEGVPDHKSPYWGVGNALYEAYNGTNTSFNLNPNRISEQDNTYTIPKNPSEAANKSATSLGSIGVSLNGVAFFNQYAGPNNQPLTNEINSFDQYNGHPQNSGVYHYHIEPTYLISEKSDSAFLGLLLDGFPVYGPVERGITLSSDDLDDYHGHFGATADFPCGIYHYHITEDDPYINGDGYYGSPGSVN